MDTHNLTLEVPGTSEDLSDDINHLFVLSQHSSGKVMALPSNRALSASSQEVDFLVRHMCENLLSLTGVSNEFCKRIDNGDVSIVADGIDEPEHTAKTN